MNFIVIYRSVIARKEVISTIEDDLGTAIVFESRKDAEEAIDKHLFVKHCTSEILEINI